MSPDTIVDAMLSSEETCSRVARFIQDIFKAEETEMDGRGGLLEPRSVPTLNSPSLR